MGLFDGLLDDDTEKMNNYTEPTKKEERAPEGETDPDTNILLRHLDPRPDIKSDHDDWVDVLQNCLLWAGLQDGKGLHGVLHGLRCGGARLAKINNAMGYKLLPGSEDWKDKEKWGEAKEGYLDGVKDDLVAVFKFTKVHGKLPEPGEVWAEGCLSEGKQTKLF